MLEDVVATRAPDYVRVSEKVNDTTRSRSEPRAATDWRCIERATHQQVVSTALTQRIECSRSVRVASRRELRE